LVPSALTIAGSDPSGGAGLQADLKTFQAFGVWGTSAVTLLTVQNTRGVSAVYGIPEDTVRALLLHLGEESRSLDLVWEGGELTVLEAPRLESRNTHGSGCVFAAAIAASLARGHSCLDAIRRAKAYVFRGIERAPGLGTGVGPVGIPQGGGAPPRNGGSGAWGNGRQCGSSAE